MSSQKQNNYLYEGSEWTFSILDDVYNACEEVALNDLKLDVYQILEPTANVGWVQMTSISSSKDPSTVLPG